MDETGIQTVPEKLPKIVSDQGQNEVAKNVSAEQGQTVTVICCLNANGGYMPPYFIFKRKRENPLLIKNGPIGCKMAVTDKGLPRHTSHKTQPLDRVFFKPLKIYYNQVTDSWQSSHPGQPSVLPQAPTSVLDRSPEEDFIQEPILDFGNDNCDSALDFPVPGPSRLPDPVLSTMSPGPVSTSPLVSVVSPADILPLPKATRRKRSGRSLKSTLLTSSPHKKALRDKKLRAERLVEEKEDRKIKNAMKRKDKLMMAAKQKKKPRRGLQFDSDDSSQSQSISSGTSVYNESESDSDQNMEESSEWMVPPKRCIGEFCAVRYEEKLFPGVITGASKTHATVSSMVKAGKLWKWPDRPDILDYEWGSVVSSIKESKKKSAQLEMFIQSVNWIGFTHNCQ
ncbi:unnamed protein product, partial [Iphiclides podalirius]